MTPKHETTSPVADNHANQLNRNTDAYWQARGYPERPEDWETRDPSLPPSPDAAPISKSIVFEAVRWHIPQSVMDSFSRGYRAMNGALYRTRVPGGWLVTLHDDYLAPSGLTFVPDPTHSWLGCSR